VLMTWHALLTCALLAPLLPWSEATGKAPGARAPRGCALSWQTRYLHEYVETQGGRSTPLTRPGIDTRPI
jgi:hypothetical protein